MGDHLGSDALENQSGFQKLTNHNKRRQLTCPTNIDSETVKIANRMKLVGKLLGRTRLYFTFFIIIFNAQKGCISNTFLLSFGVHDMYIVYALHSTYLNPRHQYKSKCFNSHSERPDAGHGDDDCEAYERANAENHPEQGHVVTQEH